VVFRWLARPEMEGMFTKYVTSSWSTIIKQYPPWFIKLKSKATVVTGALFGLNSSS